MLISVIISTYNGSCFIEKCVNSILAQTYKNIEIILYDDASKDNTRQIQDAIQEKYPNIVRSYGSEINKGPGGGKNEGIKYARGDYLYFCDADDYLGESTLANLCSTAVKESLPDIVIGGFTKVDSDGKKIYERIYSNAEKAKFHSFHNWGKLIKRLFVTENSILIPSGRVLDDILFQSAMILCDPSVAVCPRETGYFYVQNVGSVSNTYMNSFIDGVLDLEMAYLIKLKRRALYNSKNTLLTYFAIRLAIWHLLKSGSGVGAKKMNAEYGTAFIFLEKYFPDYRKAKHVFSPKNERFIIKMAVFGIMLLHKLRLSRLFFIIYSKLLLKKLWPRM